MKSKTIQRSDNDVNNFFLTLSDSVRTFAPEENCPPVRARVWFRVNVRFRVREQFFSGAIVLEPYPIYSL